MKFGEYIKQTKGVFVFHNEENTFMSPEPTSKEEIGDEKEHTRKKRNITTAIGIVFGFCFMFALIHVAVVCFIIDAVPAVDLFKSLASIIVALCSIF